LFLWVLHANVSPDFTPVRSQLSDARGFSRGLLNFVVLPGDRPFQSPPGWAFAAVVAVFVLLGFQLKLDGARAQEVGSLFLAPSSVLAGVGVTLLFAVAMSPYASRYRVVLAPRTFVLCMVLSCAPRAFSAVAAIRAEWPLSDQLTRRLHMAACAALGMAFFGSAMIQTLATYGGNYSGFLHLSHEVVRNAPFLQERPDLARSLIVYDAGYDGQFMYLMTFDPFLEQFKDRPQEYRAFIDDPPYRYGRIGFSLLTDVISGRRPELFPSVMVWLIVAAHFALTALLASIAMRHGISPLAALWYVAIPGFMSSLVSALPEVLAAAALVAGLGCWEQRRNVLAAVCFAAALLVRETGIILLLALVVTASRRDWKRPAVMLTLSVLPAGAWRMFVASRLFADFGWHAVLANPGDLGTPFAGLIHLWTAAVTRTQAAPEVAAALTYPVLVTAALALGVRLLRDRPGALELAAVVYGLLAVLLNYDKIWSHVPSGERGTFELFLCLLLLLLESRERRVWIRRSLTGLFVLLLAYTFVVAPDAATSRAALLVIR